MKTLSIFSILCITGLLSTIDKVSAQDTTVCIPSTTECVTIVVMSGSTVISTTKYNGIKTLSPPPGPIQ